MKKIALIVLLAALAISLTACSQASRVSRNISVEADSFNVTRRLSVINMRSDKPLFELIGQFSVNNTSTNELAVTCQTGPNEYKKHYVYLNDWTMYVIEDVSGANVNPYRYEINFLPEMLLPVEFVSIY